jgi:hypothetical protein
LIREKRKCGFEVMVYGRYGRAYLLLRVVVVWVEGWSGVGRL